MGNLTWDIAAIRERKKKRERDTWTLHHWTTTLDITTAVDIASMNNNIGHCSHQARAKKKERERDSDIASLDNNIGHYNCCGHCNTGQHWTTTMDITAINNKNAVDIASMYNNIGHCSHQAKQKKERERESWTLHHWT